MNTTQDVWDQFSSPLREFFRRRVHDENVAEDLLQDLFVKIHTNLSGLADGDRIAAWLFRMARNLLTDHYRRRPQQGLEEISVSEEPSDDENINQQVGQWLSQLVASLPDDYREAMTLSELEGVPQVQIAEQIGLSLSGTKSRIQRGRKLLKEALLRCCHFEFDRNGNFLDYAANRDCADCCGRTGSET